MKAMLYADWMNLRRSMKAIMIAIIVIALVSIVSGKGLSFVPAMLCMLSLMVPATLMSSDYAYGWDKLRSVASGLSARCGEQQICNQPAGQSDGCGTGHDMYCWHECLRR